ncbi:hypothetical protein [Chryseobacterium sp. SG20098]|uniref:hypothetical protein n=1 Tax=Chryseobacterium sp. SG20098 TaxID=3074145 RepID=UPI002882F8C2|nr:hypothetical protein [Chryseobacterium sp. SG20098]WNI38865.1 hypothetical protein RHP76_10295 [Chryseobacterium sp. SG20098]
MLNLPSESECAERLKELVLERGLRCKCNDTRGFYWKKNRACFECKNRGCKATLYLKGLTKMRGSKFPFRVWLGAVYLYVIDQNVTATEMQEQLGYDTYSTMWQLLKTIKKLDAEISELREKYRAENDNTNAIPERLLHLWWLDIRQTFIFSEPSEVQNSIWNWLIDF